MLMWKPQNLIREYQKQGSQAIHSEMWGVSHFDHLLAYTSRFRRPSDMVADAKNTRITSLWLTSYLAHWGMFRGSSELKRTNILFFDHLSRSLLNERTGALKPFFHVGLESLHEQEQGVIKQVLCSVSQILRDSGVSPTPTLVSKLILGCTNTVPGYDRYVCLGLKLLKQRNKHDVSAGLSERGLRSLSLWYADQKWPTIYCVAYPRVPIPAARMADMALSVYGAAG